MTTTELLKISLRQNAIFIPTGLINSEVCNITESTVHFVANISKLGFGLSEPLLQTINTLNPTYKLKILKVLQEVLGINKNWTPLVKGWDVPTGERKLDHILTLFANTFKTKTGTTLPCGHLIPLNTFPLERYNGCPFCGTPFEFGTIENYGKGNKLKVLEWWAEEQLLSFMNNLLTSKTALDATQTESLKVLIQYFPLPKVQIEIKETLMIVIDTLIENNKETNASKYLTNPTDILRYLWYKKTGLLQIVKPNTIIKRIENNNRHVFFPSDNSAKSKLITKLDLKLKYSRKECLMIATWLNNLEGTSEKNCTPIEVCGYDLFVPYDCLNMQKKMGLKD